jgi:enoyl-[acyl-carrier-protein] reductase (NADH)
MGKEDDVSNVVVFLSSSLSNYITGQNIILDGGYSIS